MLELHLRGEDGDVIIVRVFGRLYPGSRNFWEENWLVGEVEFSVAGIAARYSVSFLGGFQTLLAEMRHVYATVGGRVRFAPNDGQLEENLLKFELEMDRLGNCKVTGSAAPNPSRSDAIHFTMKLDQSYLPPLLEELAEIVTLYPEVPTPPSWSA